MPFITNRTPSKKTPASALKAILTLIIFGLGAYWIWGGAAEKSYTDSTIEDLKKNFQMAVANGHHDDACGTAGLIAQFYLNKGDAQNYNAWKAMADQEAKIWMRH